MTHDKWRQVKLSDIAEITMGNSPPGESYNTSGHGTPLINGPVEFSEDPLGSTIKSKWTTAPTKHCKQGDLLICVRGSTTGRTNVAAFDACIGRGVAAVRALECQPFLNRFLCSLRQYIFNSGKGSTFPSISQEQLACLPILLPPLPEQKRIAAILNAADALRAKRRESIEQLDSLVQATFLEMFGDPVTNPKGWKVKPLDEICNIQVGFAFSSKSFLPPHTGRALCRGINVGLGRLVWDDRMDWSAHPDLKIDKYILCVGDIVLAMDRPWISGGLKMAVITDNDLPALLVQRVCRMRCQQESARPVVHAMLRSDAFRRHCNPTETTIPHISPVEVKAFPILSPPIDLQQRFASIVESIEQQKARLQAHLAELDALCDSLQSRAFSGELCSSSLSQQHASA